MRKQIKRPTPEEQWILADLAERKSKLQSELRDIIKIEKSLRREIENVL